MKLDRVDVENLVYAGIDELNDQRSDGQHISRSGGTELLGTSSGVDSLELVNLIVTVEQKVGEQFGVAIALADESAMSFKRSPFRTVATLIDHALVKVREVSP